MKYLGDICTMNRATVKMVVLKFFQEKGLIGLCAKFALSQSPPQILKIIWKIKQRVKVAVGERNAGCQAGERNICPQDSAAPTTSSSSRHLLLVKDIRRNIGMF